MSGNTASRTVHNDNTKRPQSLVDCIDRWERISIEHIQQAARDARRDIARIESAYSYANLLSRSQPLRTAPSTEQHELESLTERLKESETKMLTKTNSDGGSLYWNISKDKPSL